MKQNPYRRELRTERTTPGSAAYPEAKADGDQSMSSKRELPEGVYGRVVPRDLRDKVRATLHKPQSPTMKRSVPRSQRPKRGRRYTAKDGMSSEPSGRRLAGSDPAQGDGQGAYLALEKRLVLRECGMAYGTRVLWSRSLRSSPGTGKPLTWRRETGVCDGSRGRREMRKSRNFPEVIRSVWPWKTGTGERCARKPARTVRGGADRKVSATANRWPPTPLFWDRVYCCPTAAKPPVERAGHSIFLQYLQVKRRADERTRTAYPCSLRVCGQGLLSVARDCESRISKRSVVPSIARYCTGMRPG